MRRVQREQQQTATPDLVGLHASRTDDLDDRLAVLSAEFGEDGVRVLRPTRPADRGVERGQGMLGPVEQEQVNGAEEHVHRRLSVLPLHREREHAMIVGDPG